MGKRLLIGFFSVCIIAIIVFLYKYSSKNELSNQKSVLEIIPMNAALIVEIKDYNELITQQKENLIWQNLTKIGYFNLLNLR